MQPTLFFLFCRMREPFSRQGQSYTYKVSLVYISCVHYPNPQPDETSVVAENQVIFKDVGFLDAIESMMMLYYICNVEYPKECFNTFLFLQRQVLKVHDTQKVPTKVLVLMSDIEKL